MRNLFTQKEAIRAAEMFGIKPFTRGNIWYWVSKGVFPKPYSQIKGGIAWYRREDLILGLINVSNRLIAAGKRDEKDVLTYEDVDNTLDIVAQDHSDITKELFKMGKEQ